MTAATIFLEVGDRLDTAAGLVPTGSRDEELLTEALWRVVERAVTGQGCGGDEEHRLEGASRHHYGPVSSQPGCFESTVAHVPY